MLAKLNFLLLLLLSHKKEHFVVFFISVFLIFLLASVLFISSSIRSSINTTLEEQADFTITRFVAGKERATPLAWVDEFLEIKGVSNVIPRVQGTYFYESKEEHFTIIGIDFFQNQSLHVMQTLVNNLDLDKFLEKKNMIIGAGVKAFLDKFAYTDYYIFRPADKSKEKVYIYDTFTQGSEIVTNDVIIMEMATAKKILSLRDDEVTDILINVSNKEELESLHVKLILSHFDMQILKKEDTLKYYKNLFNYKGGVFLVLYVISFVLFLLIIYQKYSMIRNSEKKEIAILRSLGWQISEIISFKLFESAIVVVSAYLFGVIIAFLYVFKLNAPLLKQIFLGYANLSNEAISFTPVIHYADLALLFLIFVLPFLLMILTPIWRVATIEPSEILR